MTRAPRFESGVAQSAREQLWLHAFVLASEHKIDESGAFRYPFHARI